MPSDVGLCEESDFVELDNGDLLFIHRAEHYDGENYVSVQSAAEHLSIERPTVANRLLHRGADAAQRIPRIAQDPATARSAHRHRRHLADRSGPSTLGRASTFPAVPTIRARRNCATGDSRRRSTSAGDDEYGKVDQTIVGQTFRLEESPKKSAPILGLTGKVGDVKTAVAAADDVKLLSEMPPSADIDLTRMAEWALHYLTETPRKDLGYEPSSNVIRCNALQCRRGQDPVVACDTDARMDWEWYFMRDITGSKKGAEVEAPSTSASGNTLIPMEKCGVIPAASTKATSRRSMRKRISSFISGARRKS
jgi:hypothetical protein